MKGKYNHVFFIAILFVILFPGSCGLEDYPTINPVPQSNVVPQFNDRATVRIPSGNDGKSLNDFHFIIFYRIYVSDIPVESTTRDTYSAINSTLASDYSSIYPYIDSDTLVNTNMDSLFQGRSYKYLHLQNGDLDSVLNSSVLGKNLIFDFTSSKNPTLTIDSAVYTLQRSNGNGSYTPLPQDRLFVNREDLWKSANINANTNADVVNKSGVSDSTPEHYTYAVLFIAAVGYDATSYMPVYSTPSLIHVFRLPDAF